MGKGIRTIIAAAAAFCILAPAAFADTATTDLFLARDDCGGTDNPRLDFDLGASTDGCGNLLGILGGATTAYPAKAGMPITIDGTRHVVIDISVSSFTGTAIGGIGDQTIAVQLVGTDAATNRKSTIAQGSDTKAAADMLRNTGYVAEFNVPIVGGFYKALTLNVTVGGSELHGFVNTDGNSLVSLPVPDPV